MARDIQILKETVSIMQKVGSSGDKKATGDLTQLSQAVKAQQAQLATFRSEYKAHTHWFRNNVDEGGKKFINLKETGIPRQYCQQTGAYPSMNFVCNAPPN
jgi:hypothetical protein